MNNVRRDADDMLTAMLYKAGLDPVTVTEKLVETHLWMLFSVLRARVTEPAAFPGVDELTPAVSARKIIASMLTAGWTHPMLEADPPDPQ